MSDAENDGSGATQTETDPKGNQAGAVTEERAKRKAAQEETRTAQQQNAQLQSEIDALRNQKNNVDENKVQGLTEEDMYNPQKVQDHIARQIQAGLSVGLGEFQKQLNDRDLAVQMTGVRDGIEMFQDETLGSYATEILANRVAIAKAGQLETMEDYQDMALDVAKELSSLKATQSERNESKAGEFEPTKPTAGAGGEVTQLKTDPAPEKRTWEQLKDAAKERAGKFSAKWHSDRTQGT